MDFITSRDVPPDTDVLAVPVFQGDGTLDSPDTLVELDHDFLLGQGFEGRMGQTEALLADDGSTVLVVGLGKRDDVDAEALRRAAANMVRAAWRANRIATTLADAAPDAVDRPRAAQAVTEGAYLAGYQFGEYKSEFKPCRVDTVVLVGRGGAAVDKAVQRGLVGARAACFARDLVNQPPGAKPPRVLEQEARRIAEEQGLELTVWDEDAVAADGLGGLAGVAAGSDEPPRMLRLVYEPPGARGTLAIVGKGITFDSGGLSIKTGEGMMTMKSDMSGAAAVLAAMEALPQLGIKTKVIGYAACTENLSGGKAMKPGDVLRIRNGKTVEVLNTDAEGRLVLADALSLAVEDKPDAIVDLATLTGACITALGQEIAGAMGNSDALMEQVEEAGAAAGETYWRLPLPKRYRRHIDSGVADIKNIGAAGGRAGALTAGLFLQEFVNDVPWVHLDIAGPSFTDADDGYVARGGTGFGVRTILELASAFRRPRARTSPKRS